MCLQVFVRHNTGEEYWRVFFLPAVVACASSSQKHRNTHHSPWTCRTQVSHVRMCEASSRRPTGQLCARWPCLPLMMPCFADTASRHSTGNESLPTSVQVALVPGKQPGQPKGKQQNIAFNNNNKHNNNKQHNTRADREQVKSSR